MNTLRSFIFIAMMGCAACAPLFNANDLGAQYLGAKYVLDPLGEGAGYDSDPLIRFDAFDCTTFVETVLAGGDAARLNKIRYADGVVAFENRNHFIETDWLTNNADLVENVSGQYGLALMRDVTIDKRAWASVAHGIKIDVPVQSASLLYIPYSELSQIDNQEPLIVLFVVGPRVDNNAKLATDIAVVHMGFLLPGGRVLRHASTGRGVVDDDFAQYVAKREKMQNNIGIALVKIK